MGARVTWSSIFRIVWRPRSIGGIVAAIHAGTNAGTNAGTSAGRLPSASAKRRTAAPLAPHALLPRLLLPCQFRLYLHKISRVTFPRLGWPRPNLRRYLESRFPLKLGLHF